MLPIPHQFRTSQYRWADPRSVIYLTLVLSYAVVDRTYNRTVRIYLGPTFSVFSCKRCRAIEQIPVGQRWYWRLLTDALAGLIANLIMSTLFYVPQNALAEGDVSLNTSHVLNCLSCQAGMQDRVGDLQKIITAQKQHALIQITLTPISSSGRFLSIDNSFRIQCKFESYSIWLMSASGSSHWPCSLRVSYGDNQVLPPSWL